METWAALVRKGIRRTFCWIFDSIVMSAGMMALWNHSGPVHSTSPLEIPLGRSRTSSWATSLQVSTVERLAQKVRVTRSDTNMDTTPIRQQDYLELQVYQYERDLMTPRQCLKTQQAINYDKYGLASRGSPSWQNWEEHAKMNKDIYNYCPTTMKGTNGKWEMENTPTTESPGKRSRDTVKEYYNSKSCILQPRDKLRTSA